MTGSVAEEIKFTDSGTEILPRWKSPCGNHCEAIIRRCLRSQGEGILKASGCVISDGLAFCYGHLTSASVLVGVSRDQRRWNTNGHYAGLGGEVGKRTPHLLTLVGR